MADYDDRVGLIEDELPEQLPENLRSVREGHLTHRGATALFRTLRTLGPAATALLLGLVLLAAVTLAAFGGTARWSASAPVLLTDVLDPGPLQYWHCSKEEMNVPMQILDRSKAKRGPWDFDFLEVETGNYKRIVSLPSMEHDGFHGEKLNACAMNNLDEYIYCVLQVRKDKKYELYIVRVGIVDYDTKLAGIHFVARVRPGSIYSAAFDMEGTFYFGPKKLHVIKDLHLAEGKSFLLRSEAMNLMNAPSYKVHKDCQGADYAFWEKEVDGKKLKILWMLRDFKVTALDVTTPGQATCKVWKSDGIPSNTRGHYGAGWTFKKPDGSVAVYFSNNAGRGVYGIDHSRLDLNSDTIHMYKVGESEATSKNDGANCMSMSSVSPFKAEPPKFLAPIEEKPAVEEKTEPEPTKEKTPPPSKEKTPGQDVPQKAAEIPTLSVKDKDDSVVEVSYEWVLMGPKTVCRQTPQDPIIWPANHVDRVLTIAHVCHDPPPCQLLPLSTPLTREDCQKRCMEFENCRGVEYRHSEDRCEILARPTEWFIDNTKHRTVGGPLDFECWLYKPTCDVLIQLRDHGAQSPTFDWAWRVCFGEDDSA